MTDMRPLHTNHQAFWRHMARSTGGTHRELPGGALIVATGIAATAYNQLHCDGADSAAIAEAAAFFDDRGLPWRISGIEPGAAADSFAAARGVALEPLYPIMSRAAVGVDPAPAGDFTVDVARTVDDVREFIDCAAASFGHAPELIEALAGPETVADPRFRLYLGRSGGRCVAVSVGVLVPQDGTVGVYFVGVRAESRRRGFAREVTARAIADGAGQGAATAVLQATPAGYPVYTRMGFTHAGDYLLWDFPRSEAVHAG